ncbi:hypothetical protein AK812_SmicGene11054 [Symbiodinium microadriaticum]|uniref:Uncharacterized protein n=1 Tax=Symbiodinium microadriaticum TaxID=2951 RepID=A0A1Q9EE93_SYMMI|nr:hypothetical protein AK812_SmicGene11054 [Symbiodinium microadriaticum]
MQHGLGVEHMLRALRGKRQRALDGRVVRPSPTMVPCMQVVNQQPQEPIAAAVQIVPEKAPVRESSAMSETTAGDEYGTFDARAGGPFNLPRVRVNAAYNSVLTGLGVASSGPVNYTYLWALAWSNFGLAMLARCPEFSCDWVSPVGPPGAASTRMNWPLAASMLKFRMATLRLASLRCGCVWRAAELQNQYWSECSL